MSESYKRMKEIRSADYLRFLTLRKSIRVEGKVIRLGLRKPIDAWGPPEQYQHESYTVWSFPDRGDWATHDGGYRGNWSPYIPRNLISRFAKAGDWVLDPMMGGGTTLVESKLLGRNAIGVDVNLNAVMLARDRLSFRLPKMTPAGGVQIRTYLGDARELNKIPDETIDLVATHPPYAGIIRYGDGMVEGDLSGISSFQGYLGGMGAVAAECLRVLRRGHHCGVLIGDTRRHRHFVPISVAVLNEFLKVGFVLLEDIIKIQHNTTSDRGRWRGRRRDFYKIAHEHLFIFRKPANETERRHLVFSSATVLDGGSDL